MRRQIPFIGTRGAICEDSGEGGDAECTEKLPATRYFGTVIKVNSPLGVMDHNENLTLDSVIGFEVAP